MVLKNIVVSLLLVFGLLAFPLFAQAQGGLPRLPTPIQNLVDEGAQIRYLGNEHGLDAWLTIKQGQEQYFYVKPDGSAFVMGLLFDNKGQLETVKQVARLRGEEGNAILDQLTDDTAFSSAQDSAAFKSPAERLFLDIEASNWVTLGVTGAPVLYSFVDPQCGHCHAFINELRQAKLFEKGKLQMRMIPVGFKEESKAQAAFLMASPNPQDKWFRHMDGDKEALPAKAEINQQGVERNLSVMQSWEFNVTPMVIYRAKDGKVKIVRGRPKDVEALIKDLGSRS